MSWRADLGRSSRYALVLLLVIQISGSFAQSANASVANHSTVTTALAAAASCGSSVGPGIPAPGGTVSSSSGTHARWWGQSGYPTLCPGERSTATVAYYNSGAVGWYGNAYLGTAGPVPGYDQPSLLGGDGTRGTPSTGWPSYNRLARQSAPYVGPGQIAWFQFAIQAPQAPGVYRLYLRPLIEGVSWMEDYGVFWMVTVLGADGVAPSGPSAVVDAPFVTSFAPTGTLGGAEPTLIVDFSQPMDPDRISIRFAPNAEFWWYWSSPTQLLIVPKQAFAPYTHYSVTLQGAAGGRALGGTNVFSFSSGRELTLSDSHVLTYHINGTPKPGEIADNFVSWNSFELQLNQLADHGYQFRTLESGCTGSAVCLTFDDGWATQFPAAQLLTRRGIPATFFITVENIGRPGYMNWTQVRALPGMGHKIGSHMLAHDCLSTRSASLTPSERENYLVSQLGSSKQYLESYTGQSVQYVAYPYGCFDWSTIAVARRFYAAAWTGARTMPLPPGAAGYARVRVRVTNSMRF